MLVSSSIVRDTSPNMGKMSTSPANTAVNRTPNHPSYIFCMHLGYPYHALRV